MLILGDCVEKLRELETNSIDAVVTDPPYGWRFMGKAWDGADIERMTRERMSQAQTLGKNGAERQIPRCSPSESAGKYDLSLTANQSFQEWTRLWAIEAFRILKPGGHMLIFCGPRTYHRMASGVEDAGFEIRDQLQWLFGSGFPKSLDISKSIDKQAGVEREVIGINPSSRPDSKKHNLRGFDNRDGSEDVGSAGMQSITAPATPDAKKWQGFGTALKPANEPIVLARKPLEKGLTVAENVLKYGTGGLNIDGCRVGTESLSYRTTSYREAATGEFSSQGVENETTGHKTVSGRFPANLILDEQAAQMLDAQTGERPSAGKYKEETLKKEMDAGCGLFGVGSNKDRNGRPAQYSGETGGASRFFYVAKASKSERNAGLEGMPKKEAPASGRSTPAEGRTSALGAPRQNFHPCVKPQKLMKYLCRLITPPNGTILDPFMGSGSTGIAAREENFKFIGIEIDPEYYEIARNRIEGKP